MGNSVPLEDVTVLRSIYSTGLVVYHDLFVLVVTDVQPVPVVDFWMRREGGWGEGGIGFISQGRHVV